MAAAAAALKKTLALDKGKRGFGEATFKRTGAVGVAALLTEAKGEAGSPGGTKLPRGHSSQRND